MSLSNFSTDILGLKDKNISFSEKIEHVVRKGIRYTVIPAKLSYTPDACPVCGTVNEDFSIIKNGTKLVILRFISNNIIMLNKYQIKMYKIWDNSAGIFMNGEDTCAN